MFYKSHQIPEKQYSLSSLCFPGNKYWGLLSRRGDFPCSQSAVFSVLQFLKLEGSHINKCYPVLFLIQESTGVYSFQPACHQNRLIESILNQGPARMASNYRRETLTNKRINNARRPCGERGHFENFVLESGPLRKTTNYMLTAVKYVNKLD